MRRSTTLVGKGSRLRWESHEPAYVARHRSRTIDFLMLEELQEEKWYASRISYSRTAGWRIV